MTRTAIMTDTNSGIDIFEGAENNIYVLPMPVIVDGISYTETRDIRHSQVYTALRERKEVHTSQPSPGAVVEMWERILNDGYDEVLYIPMSSGLSGSCLVAGALAEDYNGRIAVADIHRISVTLRESVYDALYYADKGLSADEIKDKIEANAYNSKIFLTVESLDQLKKTGRVTTTAAAVATVLNIRPVLTTEGGLFDMYAKARGSRNAREKIQEGLIKALNETFTFVPKEKICIGTAGTFEDPAEAERWTDMIKAVLPDYNIYYNALSCSIACHTGVNAAGLGISVIQRE